MFNRIRPITRITGISSPVKSSSLSVPIKKNDCLLQKILLMFQRRSYGTDVVDIIKPGIYQHNKTGKLYDVIGICRSTIEPDKEFVIYKQLYESKLNETNVILPYGQKWIRPLDEFNDEVVINDRLVKRFMRIF